MSLSSFCIVADKKKIHIVYVIDLEHLTESLL